MKEPIFEYYDKEFELEIKPYDNGLAANLSQSHNAETCLKNMPMFAPIVKLLKEYDFYKCGYICVHGAPPSQYIFFRHDKLDSISLKRNVFVLEDFMKDFEQIKGEKSDVR